MSTMPDDVDMEKNGEKTQGAEGGAKNEKMFSLKRWNSVAMWSWDVECEICAICRVQVMGKSTITFICLKLSETHLFID